MKGYVYLLVEVDKNGDERYKIGITKRNPEKRICELQTGNSSIIRLLQTYKSPNYKKVEQWLHSRLSLNKTDANNEWFHLTNEQVLDFQDICKKLDDTIQLLIKQNDFFK